MPFAPPVEEQLFALRATARIDDLALAPLFQAAAPDITEAVLRESARFAAEVLAPLNRAGDSIGSVIRDGAVTTPPGFRDAYRAYAEGGWVGLGADSAHGGQGLPFVLAAACQEQLAAANLSFSLCPMLSTGAIRALEAHGSAEQQRLYLPPLVSGRWTGTMNLTEPGAGSDVGALRTLAEPGADGAFQLRGEKIFITWGEQDFSENIIHLVLARTAGAPVGTGGISLFLVPKFLPDATGRPGKRNGVRALALERKLGIHASPTCTMAFGDGEPAIGFLVGEERGGMRAMFTMMNHARIGVGLEGVGIAERAFQHALSYARERRQGRRFGAPSAEAVPIIRHLDVQRLLLRIRARTEAARAIGYRTAAAIDFQRIAAEGSAEAGGHAALAALLTPIAKAFGTEVGCEAANLALQVFGGAGYIEETGAAQFVRDARITPIYEGTNGIQALDLVGRKLGEGAAWRALFAGWRELLRRAPEQAPFPAIAARAKSACAALEQATAFVTAKDTSADDKAAAATPYLMLFGTVLGGMLLLEQALLAAKMLEEGAGDRLFLRNKIATAHFYATQLLPEGEALAQPIRDGAAAFPPLGAVAGEGWPSL